MRMATYAYASLVEIMKSSLRCARMHATTRADSKGGSGGYLMVGGFLGALYPEALSE